MPSKTTLLALALAAARFTAAAPSYNGEPCGNNGPCPGNMMCAAQASLVDEEPTMKCIPAQESNTEEQANKKRTSVLTCNEDYMCEDSNKVCVERTFFFHEGPLNVCIGREDAEDGEWCQKDEDCKGMTMCAPQTSAPRPMSGTCVVKS